LKSTMSMLSMGSIGFSLCLLVGTSLGAGVTACSSGRASPASGLPLGFGVTNETQLSQILVGYRLSKVDADCVASHVFEAHPSTENYADGSYDVTRKMLLGAGNECDVDWHDYDFSSD
jgi:hypothetical protein